MRYRFFSLAAVIAAFFLAVLPVSAQTVLQDGSTIFGRLTVAGAPPVGTGCTIAAGSTDQAGTCTATAAAGSIAFTKTYNSQPFCVVVDQSATPVAVYTQTTAQITLTTITSGHIYTWNCMGRSGN